ncbi:hypothetical protein N1027_18035 [Herbiconiux sp. CPCC 205763]|uniref:Uncharacterized protein n=1 Tax=Herbiconiux aconitum TaxID=2970913 RepID=A0ABT2GYM9_9MICO|nr:hypothetical protein [Herbiconiux aconitum]MCS5720034.1 hypothetical protein [Herbiconiux aconitum]
MASATSRSRGMSAGFTLCAGSTRKIWWMPLAVIQSSWVFDVSPWPNSLVVISRNLMFSAAAG